MRGGEIENSHFFSCFFKVFPLVPSLCPHWSVQVGAVLEHPQCWVKDS